MTGVSRGQGCTFAALELGQSLLPAGLRLAAPGLVPVVPRRGEGDAPALEALARELSDVLDRLDERQFRAALADIAKVLVPAEVELLRTFTYEETRIAATAIKGRSEHAGGYEPIRIELIEHAESTAA